MRCNNCGWDNPDGNSKCEKCNSPLQSGQPSSPSRPDSNVGSTIWEGGPFEPKIPKTIPAGTIGGDTIPDPGPVINPQPQAYPDKDKGKDQAGYGTGTVNPYSGMGAYVPVSHCILKPVIFPGEDIRDAPKPVNLKGDYIELNRQSIDPENNTITSKVQAALTHKDGKWYIQNQSTQKTTYVYAGEPVALKSGDIILMGNRTFVFEED